MLQGSGFQRLLKSLHLKIFLTTSVNNIMTEDDHNSSSPNSHDNAVFGSNQAALPRPADGALDPLAAFIKELEGLSIMTGPDLSDIIDNLLIPQQQEIKSMTVHNVVQV